MESRLILNELKTACNFGDELCGDILRDRIFIENVDQQDKCITSYLLKFRVFQIFHQSLRKFQIVKELITNDRWKMLI